MTNLDNSSLEPESAVRGGRSNKPAAGRRRPLIVATGILVCGVAIGAGGLAFAAMMPGHSEWQNSSRLAHIQRFVHNALDSAGATTAQEAKVHDIIAATFADVTQGADQREAVRKQMLDLLRAPTVDAAAIEKLRAERIARMDAISTKITSAFVDAANQLTPKQRATLADRFEAMAQHGRWGGAHAGWMHRFFDKDHHPEFEQNHDSDGQPDKG
jgi:protein CpxP